MAIFRSFTHNVSMQNKLFPIQQQEAVVHTQIIISLDKEKVVEYVKSTYLFTALHMLCRYTYKFLEGLLHCTKFAWLQLQTLSMLMRCTLCFF